MLYPKMAHLSITTLNWFKRIHYTGSLHRGRSKSSVMVTETVSVSLSQTSDLLWCVLLFDSSGIHQGLEKLSFNTWDVLQEKKNYI